MSETETQFVSASIRGELTYRQAQNLDAHYRAYHDWLHDQGKDPERHIGLTATAVRYLFYRTQQFHQWVWEGTGRHTTHFTHAQADQYERALARDEIRTQAGDPYTEGSKRKLQDAVAKYFLWVASTGSSEAWEPTISFSQQEYDPADYLTLEERDRLYEATLTYDDLGNYNDLTPDERDRRKGYLAQKLGKPKADVTPADFETCRTSWKIPSLVSVALDLGLRPIEVERSRCGWHKPEKGVFQIPKAESTKSDSAWESVLSQRSNQLLAHWLDQRATIPNYDDSESVWLNREGNPYNSGSLNYLFGNLLDEAGIDQSSRKLTWYSIRRSTGTYLANFRSLAYAKEQLRHKSLQSTLAYVELPVEARRNALDQLSRDSLELGSSRAPASVLERDSGQEGVHDG